MNLKRIFTIILAMYSMLPISDYFENIIISNDVTVSAEENMINGISESKYYDMVNDTIYLVNEYRKSQGLQPFKTSTLLNDMARQRAKEQEITGMSHTRPDGLSCFTIYDDYNVDWSALAENSASGQTSPESVLEGWKNSTYHNQNMLSDYQYVGIGVTYYEGVYYWIQMFCSTTDTKIIDTAYTPEKLSNDSSQTTTITTIYDEKTLQKGDINEDGKIDIIDLILLKKYILGLIANL